MDTTTTITSAPRISPDSLVTPESSNTNTKKSAPKPCIQFLLGVLCAKWLMNHNTRSITLAFPATKAYLALALKKRFGGSIYTVTYRNNSFHSIRYQVRSKESFKLIHKAVLDTPGLPMEFRLLAKSYLNR
jgi:hypothetical protein